MSFPILRRHPREGGDPDAYQLTRSLRMRAWVPAHSRMRVVTRMRGRDDVTGRVRFRYDGSEAMTAARGHVAPPHMSSSGLSRGSSFQQAPALADRWMAGTSPAMTMWVVGACAMRLVP